MSGNKDDETEKNENLENFDEISALVNENISFLENGEEIDEENDIDENSMIIEEDEENNNTNTINDINNNSEDTSANKKILLPNKWTPIPSDKWISAKAVKFQEDYIKNIPNNVKTPYDYFRLFFDDSYNKQLAQYTNNYAEY